MEKKIEIQNLKCGGCAKTITNRVSEVEGVQNVSVDLETSIVTVELTSEEVLQEVEHTLAKSGYPKVGEENSFGSKATSFVSCAVGRLS